MEKLPEYKRGNAFSLGLKYEDANGNGIDLTHIDIRSQLRTSIGALVCELLVSKANQTSYPGEFSLYVQIPKDSKAWPVGLIFGDVKLTLNGQPVSSGTFQIPVVEGVTE